MAGGIIRTDESRDRGLSLRERLTIMAREAIHVGEHIADELEEMKMTPAQFAKKLKIPVKRLKEILDGKRDLDGDTALRLGHFFNTGPDIWMSLQNLYELRLAE